MDIHKNELKGKTVAEVETMFLKKACVLDTYGVDPHAVKVNIIIILMFSKNINY